MSAFDDAEYEPSPWDPINEEVELFERTSGVEPSQIVGEQWVILWTLGARSGNVRKTPLVRVADGDSYAVIGSMGGMPNNPNWVHNLRANPVAGSTTATDSMTSRCARSMVTRRRRGGRSRRRSGPTTTPTRPRPNA